MDNRNIIRTIENESPDIHWGFLPVKDKVVLDLGSGLNSEFMPTPYYFLQECKAKKVYGVDASEQSYTWYKQNFNVQHFIQFMDYVDRVEKFEWYINAAKPDILKVDVEGAEIFMNAIKPELLKDITNIAVEYHNLPCLLSVEGLFKDNGYKLEYYKFNHLDIDFQGVIHAYKPTNLFVELEKIN